MAAYISVPRDLTRVKTKVFFGLTKRQLLCFGAAALIGVPSFFLLKSCGNLSLAAMGMVIIMLPLFFLAISGSVSKKLPTEKTASAGLLIRHSLSLYTFPVLNFSTYRFCSIARLAASQIPRPHQERQSELPLQRT